MMRVESNIKKGLEQFTNELRFTNWLKKQCAIGPVIAAGLAAHLDIRKAVTAGHFWSFGGYVKDVVWEKGKKRPWNAELKRLYFIIGDCFTKFKNHRLAYYGKLVIERKNQEIEHNEMAGYLFKTFPDCREIPRDQPLPEKVVQEMYRVYGDKMSANRLDRARHFMLQAAESLAKHNFGKKTKAYAAYIKGTLPDGRIQLRAQRWAVKIFLDHVHAVMYWDYFNSPPPVPYVFSKTPEGTPRVPGEHRHLVPIPFFDRDTGVMDSDIVGKPLSELYSRQLPPRPKKAPKDEEDVSSGVEPDYNDPDTQAG
jgi:hypothetical protein